MNRDEHSSRDPRRGLPSAAELRRTNIPLEEDREKQLSERETIERAVNDLEDNRPAR